MKKNKRARPARDPQEDEWILAMGNVYVKNAEAGLTEHPALSILAHSATGYSTCMTLLSRRTSK